MTVRAGQPGLRPSPEIVARQPLELRDGPEALGADGHRAVLPLELSLDDEGARADDDRALLFEEVRPHDGLQHSRLVLEREEHEAFRRARALADDDWLKARDRFAGCRDNSKRI